MTLRRFANPDKLVMCSADTTITEAANLMWVNDVGAVLVVLETGEPVGILTDRDIVIRGLCQGLDCDSERVREIMTTPVETLSVDCGLANLFEKMRQVRVRRIALVDEDGRAVGLLSSGDLLELLAEELEALAEAATSGQSKIVSVDVAAS